MLALLLRRAAHGKHTLQTIRLDCTALPSSFAPWVFPTLLAECFYLAQSEISSVERELTIAVAARFVQSTDLHTPPRLVLGVRAVGGWRAHGLWLYAEGEMAFKVCSHWFRSHISRSDFSIPRARRLCTPSQRKPHAIRQPTSGKNSGHQRDMWRRGKQ